MNSLKASTQVYLESTNNSIAQAKGLVSVIIPNYNHAQYVRDAIQSVLNQEYHNFEIIIVDDGSTDNSREVIAQFGSQVNYIWQENHGLSAARNTGIRAAKGEFIGVLDADDLYEPNYLKSLVSILETNPQVDAVYCRCWTVDESNRLLPQIIGKTVPSRRLHDVLLTEGGFFPPLCILVRKYCYDTLGFFDEAFQGCADWDMWLRLSEHFNVIGTEKVLARYRVVPESMSSDPIHMMKDRFAVLKKHFPDGSSITSGWNVFQREAYGQAYLMSVIDYLQYHDEYRVHECLCEMARVYPNLLSKLDTFYELGLGGQPKGFRGDFSNLSMDKNANALISMLDRLFGEPELSIELKDRRDEAYANAYFALGLLSYGAREMRTARKFFIEAIKVMPKFGVNRRLLSLILKSLLGEKIMNRIHQIRMKRHPNPGSDKILR